MIKSRRNFVERSPTAKRDVENACRGERLGRRVERQLQYVLRAYDIFVTRDC